MQMMQEIYFEALAEMEESKSRIHLQLPSSTLFHIESKRHGISS